MTKQPAEWGGDGRLTVQRAVPYNRPLRPDGKPNCPLMFSVAFR